MPYAFPWDPPSNPYWKSPTASTLTTPTDPASTGSGNITNNNAASNVAAAPNLTSLTNLINSLNQQAQTSANAARIPNAPALEQQSSTNIGSMLKGELPADVVANLSQQAAERGISTGSPGSPNSNASLLRTLGLNSLQLQQQGQQNLSTADQRNPGSPLFDTSSQLLTPAQSGSLGLGQGQLALDWLKFLNPRTQTGSSGGRTPAAPSGTDTNPNMDWFSRALATADSGSGVLPPRAVTYPGSTSLYPGTSVPGLPDLGSILGPQDPNYNPAPSNTTTTGTSSTWDPFAGYYDTGSNVPANTVTTDTSSTYDPFSGYY